MTSTCISGFIDDKNSLICTVEDLCKNICGNIVNNSKTPNAKIEYSKNEN